MEKADLTVRNTRINDYYLFVCVDALKSVLTSADFLDYFL